MANHPGKFFLTSLLACSLLLSCHPDKPSVPDPLDQLPPITQTGANTFGCLLNGKAWTPKGNNSTSNYRVYYDPTYLHGTLNIFTYRYPTRNENDKQMMTLFSDSLTSTGNYPLTVLKRQEALFTDRKTGCSFYQGESHYRSGTLTITRLDLGKGIISGTFEFTLAKPGCNTVRVTNGRFDKQL